MSSFRARCTGHREWSGGGHEGERVGPCSRVLPVARETGRVPDGTARCLRGEKGPESGRHARGTASSRGESTGAPTFGAVCGHRGGQQAALEVGQARPLGRAARGTLPHACPPSSRRPGSGGQQAPLPSKDSSIAAPSSPRVSSPPARSQPGQREGAGAWREPRCLLELSPGQRVARALSRVAHLALSWGAVTPPTGGLLQGSGRSPEGWLLGEAGPAVQRAGREEVGLTQQGGKGIRQERCLRGSATARTWGPGEPGA